MNAIIEKLPAALHPHNIAGEQLALKEAAARFPGRHVKVTADLEGQYLVHEQNQKREILASNIARITVYADGSAFFERHAHVPLPELTVLNYQELLK